MKLCSLWILFVITIIAINGLGSCRKEVRSLEDDDQDFIQADLGTLDERESTSAEE